MEIGSIGLIYSIAALVLPTIVSLAVLIWFIASIQSMKKSLRNIEEKIVAVASKGGESL